MDWLKDKHGEENIISATIHRDETTPHLAAFVVPITKDGRLSARDYLGGRKLLSEAQTSYAKQVAHLGLERGVEKSKAQHKTIKEYYQEINEKKAIPDMPRIQAQDVEPRVTKKGLLKSEKETPAEIANRLNRKIEPAFDDMAKKANSRRFEREQAKRQRETLKKVNNDLKQLKRAFKGLDKDQLQNISEQINIFKKQNGIEKEQKDIER
jgi:hypothetical protein